MNLIIISIIILTSIILGIIVGKVVELEIRKHPKENFLKETKLSSSIRGVIIIFCILLGVYISTKYLPIDKELIVVLNKIHVVGLILLVTILLSKIATKLISYYLKSFSNLPTTSIFINLTKIIIYILGVLIILQTLGISITPLLTALGVGGLAVALALQDTLSNLFAGIHILMTKQIKPGDFIRLDNSEEGYVVDITWRNTTIKKLSGNLVIIPNSKLAYAIITNFNLPEKPLTFSVDVKISYENDLEKVEKIAIEVAKEVIKENKSFEPKVLFHTLSELGITFSVVLWAKDYTEQGVIKHEFIKKLLARFREENIKLPSFKNIASLKEI